MRAITVMVTYPSGRQVTCGTLLCGDPDSQGRIDGAFKYAESYLADPDAYALDPVHLPLDDKEHGAGRPTGIHGVFEDALPDDWGRRLLARRAGRRYLTDPEYLLMAGSQTMGALQFTETPRLAPPPRQDPVSLSALLEAAAAMERGEILADDRLMMLYSAGSAFGGARPKVTVTDDTGEWLAKFPSVKDTVNNPVIEAATLSLARDAGIPVPEFRLETVATSSGTQEILMVRRFDVSDQGGRVHQISFKTLMSADGYYNESYDNMAHMLKKVSANPSDDLAALYRQMVFNAAIGNTDDHLKNFTLMQGPNGLRLSPAYDLLPNVNGHPEHVLAFGPTTTFPGRTGLLAMHRVFGLPVATANEILSSVGSVVALWRTRFQAFGVPPENIARLARDIDRRVSGLLGEDNNDAPAVDVSFAP